MDYKFSVGDKVIVTDFSDDDEYIIGTLCTVKERSIRLHYINRGYTFDHASFIYLLEEYPNAAWIEESHLDYPSYDSQRVTEKEFDDMFG